MIRVAIPFLLALSATASHGQWTFASGTSGQRLNSLTARGSEIIAGGENGTAYRSRDDGRSWSAFSVDAALETFALSGEVLLAGTQAGIRRLAPGDSVFKRSSLGITESFRVVVAAQGRYAFAGGDWGIYRSADQGLTWSLSTQGLSDSIFSLAADSAEIVAIARNGRAYRSVDSGASWTRAAAIPGSAEDLRRCQGRTFASHGSAVLRLAGDGSGWDTVFNFAPGNYAARLFHLGSELYAFNGDGLHRSVDLGASWMRISRFFGAGLSLSGLVERGPYLYAGSSAGMYRSQDRGATWIGIHRGLAVGPARRQLAFLGDTLLAIGPGHLLISTDSGATWSARDSSLFSIYYTTLATEAGHLYVGTWGHGVLHSTDGGRTWDPAGTGLPAGKSIDGLFPRGNTLLAFVDGYKLYRSADRGATWNTAQNGIPGDVAPRDLHAMGDTFFLGTTEGTYRSVDGGGTWGRTGAGGANGYEVTRLAGQDGSLYAYGRDPSQGIGDGLHVSRNQGRDWTRIPMNGLRDTVLSDLKAYGPSLFAVTDSGLYRSPDGGRTWTAIDEGLDVRATSANSLWIHGGTVYTNAGGLWKRPLSDFGPVSMAGEGLRRENRGPARPRPMLHGGRMTVPVPVPGKRDPEWFDMRGSRAF